MINNALIVFSHHSNVYFLFPLFATSRTFAHVISLTKASDVDFAKCILEACPEGNKHMNRKQQLLFYSDRLLKDKAAKKLLEPFKFDLKTWLGGTEYMMKAQE